MQTKLLTYLNKLIKHELISGSFYLFLSVIITGFFAFLLNLFFARNLNRADYGTYASLLSLINFFTIPAASLTTIVVKYAGEYHAKSEEGKLKSLYLKTNKAMVILAVIILLVFLFTSPFLSSFLNLDNFWYIPLVGFITAVSYVGIPNAGFLQGLLKFSYISLIQILGAILRVIAGVILVFLGFKVFGAIWSSFFAFFLVFILGFIPLKFLWKKKDILEVTVHLRQMVGYAVPSIIAILCLSSFISLDVVLVKHFFSSSDAGLYGGLSLVGKVIFYFTGPIPIALFPLLVKRHAKNEPYNKLFLLSLALVLIPSIFISGFYYLYPGFTTNFFLGKGYNEIIPFLGLFGVYIGVFSLLNVCVNLFLSLKKTNIYIPLLIGSILQIVLISFFHSNFYQIISISILITGLLFIGFVIYYLVDRKLILERK